MSEHGFRFSHDKRFNKVSFQEFLATARALSHTVSTHRSSVDVKIITAEDHTTYDYTTTTFWWDVIEEALKSRKRYSVDDLTQEVWGRSFDVQLTLRDKQDPKPFMICMSCDKHAAAKRIQFFGQGLDEQTYQAVVGEFRRSSLSHSIGDGTRKISNFNLAMGSGLTGVWLPVR